jgi:hypothetical protein
LNKFISNRTESADCVEQAVLGFGAGGFFKTVWVDTLGFYALSDKEILFAMLEILRSPLPPYAKSVKIV